MFLMNREQYEGILEKLSATDAKLDTVLGAISANNGKLNDMVIAMAGDGNKSAEKLMEEGIANLMAYDGAPKGMK